MDIRSVINRKRDGLAHTEDEIQYLIAGATGGTIPDYQLSAWLMAAYLNGLNEQETQCLTLAMANSGERLDLSSLPHPIIDKHSTGGVGDKTTIVLLPWLAACGMTMIKMSGRGLGITGGTVDKLESVSGFRSDLSPAEMIKQAERIGIAWTGQSANLAPADKILYSLRNATGTVDSIPLIVSSILSKKLAGGSDTLILDVKCGSGAFAKDLADAQTLRDGLIRIGSQSMNVRAAISDMSQPLGRKVGNALEVKEAIEVLQGKSTGRFFELCLYYARLALGKDSHIDPVEVLRSGRALDKAVEWFDAQGADSKCFEAPNWQVAPVIRDLLHTGESGFIHSVDAQVVGRTVVELGGGRRQRSDKINHTVGVETFVSVGDHVDRGDTLMRIHAESDHSAEEAMENLSQGIVISGMPVAPVPVILEPFTEFA